MTAPCYPLRRRSDQPREFIVDALLDVASTLLLAGILWGVLCVCSR